MVNLRALFYAWNGNKGVKYPMFTMLTSILTPGMEIRGSKWPFYGFS
jgi:hypothetical protein